MATLIAACASLAPSVALWTPYLHPWLRLSGWQTPDSTPKFRYRASSAMWEDENGPGGVGSASRSLTHSLDSTKEGLMPNSTPTATFVRNLATPECMVGPNKAGDFQRQARATFATLDGGYVDPWLWITNACGSTNCLNAEHMIATAPTKIKYPPGVCVYCGMPAGTRDHLIPRNKSGEARRVTVAVVPACGDCNSRIGDFPSPNVDERRQRAHASIKRSARRILEAPPLDLSEYGPNLRSHLEMRRSQREVVLLRLAWPEDPYYDLRAFQTSGIEDPVALDLCAHPHGSNFLPDEPDSTAAKPLASAYPMEES